MRDMVHEHYAAMIQQRAPLVQMRDRQMVDDRILSCEVLALPLASDGETIDMMMSGVVWL
jgi:hypothetical protein